MAAQTKLAGSQVVVVSDAGLDISAPGVIESIVAVTDRFSRGK